MEDFDPVFDGFDELRDDLSGDVSIQPWEGETAPSTQTVYRDGKLVTISSGGSFSDTEKLLAEAQEAMKKATSQISEDAAKNYESFMREYGQFLTRSESDLANRIFFSENPTQADIDAFNALYDRLTGGNVVALKSATPIQASIPKGEGIVVDATHRGGETQALTSVPFYDGTQGPGTDVFVPGYGVVKAEEAANLSVSIPGVGQMTAFEAARKGLLPRASGMNQPKSKLGTWLVLAVIAYFAWRSFKKGATQ